MIKHVVESEYVATLLVLSYKHVYTRHDPIICLLIKNISDVHIV